VRRNPRRTNWADYKVKLKTRLAGCPEKFFNQQQLDEAAYPVIPALLARLIKLFILDLFSVLSKAPWWSNELAKLRTKVRRAFNKARNSHIQTYWETYRADQKEYNKAIKVAKKKAGEISVQA